jgi:hypothetical protein
MSAAAYYIVAAQRTNMRLLVALMAVAASASFYAAPFYTR